MSTSVPSPTAPPPSSIDTAIATVVFNEQWMETLCEVRSCVHVHV